MLNNQELIETNVKPEDWDAFIKKAFSHPEAFVEVPRLKKRNTRGIQNRLKEIANRQM